ncbi:MAG TPA: hypothetical protein H9717_13695 [Candidatus Eisenbergiella merdipullorum]|uniref:Uncharacterized protein n=1 Tax=Candidatus Eisenbergiella merdipullorum TaxID=2838553 RepID=A0A9D2L172_9FIRM|nr:hypothetical protein [Candidatus Eisenbergiella merdipullorum]
MWRSIRRSGQSRKNGQGGNNGRKWKEAAAAALLMLCFWGVFYPELALPQEVCRNADGSAMDDADYEKILHGQDVKLQIAFSFTEQKLGKRTENGKASESEKYREDDDVGITGIQGEAHRGI